MMTGRKKTRPIRPYWIKAESGQHGQDKQDSQHERGIPRNGLRVAVEETLLAQTPIEIVLHLRQYRVELLLKIAQGDAASLLPKILLYKLLLEVLEPLRLLQLDEPVVAARGEPRARIRPPRSSGSREPRGR